jgi:hypothetical protein
VVLVLPKLNNLGTLMLDDRQNNLKGARAQVLSEKLSMGSKFLKSIGIAQW